MRVLLIIISLLIATQNLSSRTVQEYICEIDTTHSDNFEPIISNLLNDANKYTIAGNDYTAAEYVFQGLIMSDNPLTCNRQKFVEQMGIKLKMLHCHPNIIGLIAYFNDELIELEQIEKIRIKFRKTPF